MMKKGKKIVSVMLALIMALSSLCYVTPLNAADGVTVTKAGGWNETLYIELSGVTDSDVTGVSYSGPTSGSLVGEDFKYLVRDYNGGVRVDVLGLKPGTYSITVTTSKGTVTESNIVVLEQDRSGYAHFNYTDGVGAYNDDGTLKDNAIVLYVTDDNKNTITLSYGGVTVTGIGNILNSVGQDVGGGKTSNGGTPNTNQGILKLLGQNNVPLVVRFIGCVSNTGLYKTATFSASSTPKIDGLTIYKSTNNGGSAKDNGHMARMKSAKNVTIEGIGTDAVIDGWGFHFMCESGSPDLGKSFEARNLTFINTPEDAIGMEGVQASENTSSAINGPVERCWVHNCSFYVPSISNPTESDKSEGDGSVDFKRGQYFTCSYNYYEGCHKTNLVGSGDDSLQYNLTYHHNLYKYVESRAPLARNANIHMYNNAFIGQTSYAMDARANSFIFSESNIFYMCKNPQTSDGTGVIKSYNDSFASWIKDKVGVVVEDKAEAVSNTCKYQYGGIDYSKFELDSKLSYIPTGDYKVSGDHTYVMKDLYANAGSQKADQKTVEEVTMSDVSLVPSGVTPVNVTGSLPYTTAPGKIPKTVYAFTVDTAFDFEMTSTGVVLCNEAGVAFLEGSGSVRSLPAGTYMLHAVNFETGTDSSLGTFKEVTVSAMSITSADPNFDPNKLTGIALNKTSMVMVADATATLSVSYTPSTTTEDRTVTWTTSNADVATVSSSGVVTAVSKGTAVITATVGEFTATCNVTVSEPVPLQGIALDKTSLDLVCGSTDTLTVTFTPSNTTDATDVTWSTGNESVATVSDGVVKGVGEGTTTITATVGNFTATCTVTVTLPEVPEGAYIHVFDTDEKDSEFYSISGNLSDSKGTITYNGQTLKQCLKIETATSISFTAPAAGTLTLYFGGSTSAIGKKVMVDGTKYTIDSTQILTVDVTAGSHTITKGDSINLWVMEYIPTPTHTHSYTSEVTTEATCTEAGVMTYTCGCGDSYTETIEATGHSHVKDVTTEPSCTEGGQATYTCGCGDSYTEDLVALGHSYGGFVIDKHATYTEEGEQSRYCSRCNDRIDVTVIPVMEVLESGIYGDVNADGSVNVADAVMLKQHLASITVELDEAASDVNADGVVDLKDAVKLMKALAGMDVLLGEGA